MTLFVGGPCDGERREVQKAHGSWTVMTRPPMHFSSYYAASGDMYPSNIKSVRYNKLNVCGVEIFAEASLSAHDVMRALVAGYKP